jgi:hypothetical protein
MSQSFEDFMNAQDSRELDLIVSLSSVVAKMAKQMDQTTKKLDQMQKDIEALKIHWD